jgi:L-cystine transport system permease protein
MQLNTEFMKRTFKAVLAGVPVTLRLVAVVLVVSIILGFIVAVGRKNPKSPLAKILGVYVSFARGTPTMVQIYLLYTALPTVLARTFQEHGIPFDVYSVKGMTYAYVIFSFGMTAIMSEMFRGGLAAIDKGQIEAAKSVGLTTFQGYRRIIMPQVIVYTLPVLCTNVTGLVKMSSLAFAVSVFEITAIAKTEGARYTCYVEAYLIIAVMYVVLNLLIELIFKRIEKRVAVYHPL